LQAYKKTSNTSIAAILYSGVMQTDQKYPNSHLAIELDLAFSCGHIFLLEFSRPDNWTGI
jgi:hypothetical protein